MQYHAAVQGCEALSHLHIPHVVQRIFSLKVAESFLAFFKIGVRTSIHGDFLVAFRNLQTEIAGTGVDAQESVLFPLRYFNEVVASSQRPYGAAVPVFVRSQHVHADAGDFFIQFRVVQQGLMNGGTGMHPGRDALAQACVKAGKIRQSGQSGGKHSAADIHADQVGNYLIRFQFRREPDDAAGSGVHVRHDAHPASFKGGVVADVPDLGAGQVFQFIREHAGFRVFSVNGDHGFILLVEGRGDMRKAPSRPVTLSP